MAKQYKVKLMSRALCAFDGIYRYIAQTLLEPGTALDLVNEIEKEILSCEELHGHLLCRRDRGAGHRCYCAVFSKPVLKQKIEGAWNAG